MHIFHRRESGVILQIYPVLIILYLQSISQIFIPDLSEVNCMFPKSRPISVTKICACHILAFFFFMEAVGQISPTRLFFLRGLILCNCKLRLQKLHTFFTKIRRHILFYFQCRFSFWAPHKNTSKTFRKFVHYSLSLFPVLPCAFLFCVVK